MEFLPEELDPGAVRRRKFVSVRSRTSTARLGAAGVTVTLAALATVWLWPAAAPAHPAAATATTVRPVSAAATARSSTHPTATTGSRRVFVVGDSLTLGTEPYLAAAMHRRGWTLTRVDARGGRPVNDGFAVLRTQRARLPQTVVIALGTNNLWQGPAAVPGWLRTARAIVGDRRLIWVNLCLNDKVASWLRPYRAIDAALRTDAPRYGVEVADWCGYATRHYISPGPDGIHYGPTDYRVRAAFYAAAVAG